MRERSANDASAACDSALWPLLERLELGVMLLDAAGRCLHRSCLFDELSAARTATAGVRPPIRRFTEQMLARFRSRGGSVVGGPELLGETDFTGEGTAVRARALTLPGRRTGEVALLIALDRLRRHPEVDLPGSVGLTPREKRVARLLADGHTNKEIAGALGVRPNTAKNHTQSVLRKLGLRRRSQVGALLRDRSPG